MRKETFERASLMFAQSDRISKFLELLEKGAVDVELRVYRTDPDTGEYHREQLAIDTDNLPELMSALRSVRATLLEELELL